MGPHDWWTRTALFVVSAMLGATPAAAGVTYQVNIDTSSVQGTSGFLDLQFNPGNATSQAATAQVVGFTSDGTVTTGTLQQTGDATGKLPATLNFDNQTPLNEYFQSFTFGTKITFTVVLGGPAVTSPSGTGIAGSTFGIGLYDSAQNPILTNQGALSGFVGQIDIAPSGVVSTTVFPTATNDPSVATVSPSATDAFQVRYAANLDKGDSVINVTNTGALAGADPAGRICVNVYTFDPNEEPISCCACLVTPNGLVSLSAQNDLISNPLTPGKPTSIVIKLLASAPASGGTCNSATPTAATLAPGMSAWGTTLHALPTTPVTYGTTETPFDQSELSVSELAKLTGVCGFIQTNGSGYGICKSCRSGALGAARK